jgi:hypothetical protein
MAMLSFSEVAALLRSLTKGWAIVEWVPAADPRFVGRDALYAHLDEQAFLAATDPHFLPLLNEKLKKGRTLYFFQAR